MVAASLAGQIPGSVGVVALSRRLYDHSDQDERTAMGSSYAPGVGKYCCCCCDSLDRSIIRGANAACPLSISIYDVDG